MSTPATTDREVRPPVLPSTLRLGPVHLAVTDLGRSLEFYETAIGLRLHRRDGSTADLGAGAEDLLVLVDEPDARPAGRHAGLYHFALLHPSRTELARAVQRLASTRTSISGASDHGISEAIYLSDPDGNGIELAADRPREHWGELRDPATIGPRPLDMEGLMSLVPDGEPPAGASGELVVGHVHLHVGDIETALGFYRDLLGFEVMTRFPSAAFVAAGGYHHHVGLNTWRGEGIPPAPAGVVGLRHCTVLLERDSEVRDVRGRLTAAGIETEEHEGGFVARDPWNIAVRFAVTP
jgi:catechol 2,3-dioxygenase